VSSHLILLCEEHWGSSWFWILSVQLHFALFALHGSRDTRIPYCEPFGRHWSVVLFLGLLGHFILKYLLPSSLQNFVVVACSHLLTVLVGLCPIQLLMFLPFPPLAVLGFELQGFHLLHRCSTTWATPCPQAPLLNFILGRVCFGLRSWSSYIWLLWNG
jgi:hypothetical protein